MSNTVENIESTNSLNGLWVILVENQGELAAVPNEARVPMILHSGNDLRFLLGFKNVAGARKVVSKYQGAEPRMVVKDYEPELRELAEKAGVSGVVIDYDPETQKFASASPL